MRWKFWEARNTPSNSEQEPDPQSVQVKMPAESIEDSAGYNADAPVQDPAQDRFDREPFARRVARTLTRRRDSSSMVLAIYGPWGDGKTTVLNFIRKFLSEDPSVVYVTFNPWRLEGEDALLRGFFSTLADALDARLTSTTQKIGDLFKKIQLSLETDSCCRQIGGRGCWCRVCDVNSFT